MEWLFYFLIKTKFRDQVSRNQYQQKLNPRNCLYLENVQKNLPRALICLI